MGDNWFSNIITGLIQFAVSSFSGLMSWILPSGGASGGGIFSGIGNFFKSLFPDDAVKQVSAAANSAEPGVTLASFQPEAEGASPGYSSAPSLSSAFSGGACRKYPEYNANSANFDMTTYTNILQGVEGGQGNVHNPYCDSVSGCFQFMDGTWRACLKKYCPEYANLSNKELDALKDDYCDENAKGGLKRYIFQRFTADNRAAFESATGMSPTMGWTYLCHQQGLNAAVALYKHPGENVTDVLTRDVYHCGPRTLPAGDMRTYAQLLDQKKKHINDDVDHLTIAEKAVLQNGGNINMSAAQFANKWMARFDSHPSVGTPVSQNRSTHVRQQQAVT